MLERRPLPLDLLGISAESLMAVDNASSPGLDLGSCLALKVPTDVAPKAGTYAHSANMGGEVKGNSVVVCEKDLMGLIGLGIGPQFEEG